jgi:hypothetical protein
MRLQLLEQRQADQLESQLGWPLFTEGDDRLGWLMNFTTVSLMRQAAAATDGQALKPWEAAGVHHLAA